MNRNNLRQSLKKIVAICRRKCGTALGSDGLDSPSSGLCELADTLDRAGHYRHLAAQLRGLADTAHAPKTRADLLSLARSYERLAREANLTRVVDSYGQMEATQPASNDDSEQAKEA